MKHPFVVSTMCIMSVLFTQAQVQTLSHAQEAIRLKPEPIGGFSSRTTYFIQEPARVTGLYVGADFDGVIMLTAAYNFVSKRNAPLQVRDLSTSGQRLIAFNTYRMRFASLGMEYVFFRSDRWKLSIPLDAGLGRYIVDQEFYSEPLLAMLPTKEKGLILPFEGGFSASFYFWEWLATKAMVGNRIVIGKADANAVFSGPFWQYGILFFPAAAYEKITGQPLKKLINPSL